MEKFNIKGGVVFAIADYDRQRCKRSTGHFREEVERKIVDVPDQMMLFVYVKGGDYIASWKSKLQ